MGLKIGDNIYLMDIDENTPIVLQTNNFLTITLPYMNEVLFSIGHEFVFFFLQYYQHTTYIHYYGM
jgi:hypothetical protein